MYAIIRAGGKQYKVKAGDTVRVEKLSKDLGDEFDVTDILFVGGEKEFIGEPVVANAAVTVVVTNEAKAPKILVFKKKRRQGYRKMQGHRQLYTELFIKTITTPDGASDEAISTAKIFDPMKKVERLEKKEMERIEAKRAGKKVESVKKVAKKKVAKKSAVKKKATAKKKVIKKAAKKKKVAKKATKKKATKN